MLYLKNLLKISLNFMYLFTLIPSCIFLLYVYITVLPIIL